LQDCCKVRLLRALPLCCPGELRSTVTQTKAIARPLHLVGLCVPMGRARLVAPGHEGSRCRV
jgi:hypothetical protein